MRRWIVAASAAALMWAAGTEVQEAKKLIAAKKYTEAIATLEKAPKAQAKLEELKKEAPGAWEEFKQGADAAWNDLKQGYQKAANALDDKESPTTNP